MEPRPDEPVGLEQVFIEHHARVFRAAYRVTGNAEDAEDVLQSVFLRLIHHGKTALPVANLSSYLYRAAINAAVDLLRARRERVGLEEVERAPDTTSPTPERAHAAGEIRARLRCALAALPPKAAEAFALRYLEGHRNHEIARMLGISRVTVAVTLHRTRRRLQREFQASRRGL
jgi:RNA polymerase sigma-70 factor (ECF subfamily)